MTASICLSTVKILGRPPHAIYQTRVVKDLTGDERHFSDVPGGSIQYVEILDKVEFYLIDHPPLMPTFPIPENFGTEEEYRKKFTEEDLFNEFTRDENGNVVLDEAAAHKKIENLGGYDSLPYQVGSRLPERIDFQRSARTIREELSDEIMERITFETSYHENDGFRLLHCCGISSMQPAESSMSRSVRDVVQPPVRLSLIV